MNKRKLNYHGLGKVLKINLDDLKQKKIGKTKGGQEKKDKPFDNSDGKKSQNKDK